MFPSNFVVAELSNPYQICNTGCKLLLPKKSILQTFAALPPPIAPNQKNGNAGVALCGGVKKVAQQATCNSRRDHQCLRL